MNLQNAILLFSVAILISCTSDAQSSFTNSDNIAINGFDVVSYHNSNQAIRGNNLHSKVYKGATYYFSSEANLSVFKNDPEKHLPAYGGYCAFAMAMQGATVPTDPQTFKIHNGRLYLFFNDFYEGKPFNTIVPWNSDEQAMISKANANWKKM